MAEKKGQRGTGKHPHKSTEEPYPHHQGKTTKGREEGSSSSGESKSGGSKSSDSESSDLKSGEYRDEHGKLHHHTRTAGKGK